MTDHLASIDEAIAQLRGALLTLAPNPSGRMLDAHMHVEEIAVCVARHNEDQAKSRTEDALRDSQNRMTQLRRASIRAETVSPRNFVPGLVAKGLPDADMSQPARANTRAEIEKAFGIEPKPRDGGVTAPLHPQYAHDQVVAEGRTDA